MENQILLHQRTIQGPLWLRSCTCFSPLRPIFPPFIPSCEPLADLLTLSSFRMPPPLSMEAAQTPRPVSVDLFPRHPRCSKLVKETTASLGDLSRTMFKPIFKARLQPEHKTAIENQLPRWVITVLAILLSLAVQASIVRQTVRAAAA